MQKAASCCSRLDLLMPVMQTSPNVRWPISAVLHGKQTDHGHLNVPASAYLVILDTASLNV